MVINIDETNVKLVPQERAGHVSKGAYRLFVQGRPMGRNASLSAQRSTITHVAAMCDRADFQTLLPQVVLVGANQVGEERLARIRMTEPACVRIWRYPKAWMSNAVMVRSGQVSSSPGSHFRILCVIWCCLEPTASSPPRATIPGQLM